MRKITHLGITGTDLLWEALGYSVSQVGDGEYACSYTGGFRGEAMAALVLAGQVNTGSAGDAALVWALTEHQRRKEEASRVKAQSMEAAAISALASAIRESEVENLVASLPAGVRKLVMPHI